MSPFKFPDKFSEQIPPQLVSEHTPMDMSTLTPGFLLLFGSICLGKSIEETKLVMNRATKSTPAIELKRPTSQPRRAVQLRSEEPSSSATAVITSWGLGHPGIFYVQGKFTVF
ncbi:unnamed protein product [Dicrocoelium dendriticum]|nr:unnamed protein product [Dicrocoelium dendriticum]